MNLQERILYHQIHPLKLATDLLTSFVAAWFFWRHELLWGLLVCFVPPIVVSASMLSIFDLGPYQESKFGRYVARYMTRAVEGVRLLGAAVFLVAAWYQNAWLMAAGLAVVIAAWLRGVFWPGQKADLAES